MSVGIIEVERDCEPAVCTARDLVRRLGLPKSAAAWFESEAAAGRIPGLQAGDAWLFNAEAVERCLAERAARPPAG